MKRQSFNWVFGDECRECGRRMNATEKHFYEYRCEDCEQLELARIEAWRRGVEDLPR